MEARRVALFIDVDNLWLSAQTAGLPFQLASLIDCARGQGNLAFCRAYADWSLSRQRLLDFHRFAIEMVELPSRLGNKNTADIQLALDAFELIFNQRPPDDVVIASGDRDFVPLVQKLRRYGIRVTVVGIEGAVSGVLQRACDQFISYETLLPNLPNGTVEPLDQPLPVSLEAIFPVLRRAVDLILANQPEASAPQVETLLRELAPNSQIPSLGVSFSDVLQRAEAEGWIETYKAREGDLRVREGRRSNETHEPIVKPKPHFDSAEEAAEAYRQILLSKRVPLMPWETRRCLARYLWSALAEVGTNGMSFAMMNDDLRIFAQSSDLNVPVPAIQKLTYTMNIARCFTHDGVQSRFYSNPDILMDRFSTLIDVDTALGLTNRTYIRGILRGDPSIELLPEGVALLLFDEITPETIGKAKHVIECARTTSDSDVVVVRYEPRPTIGDIARRLPSEEARGAERAYQVLRDIVETLGRKHPMVFGSLAQAEMQKRDGHYLRRQRISFLEFARQAESAGYVQVVERPRADFILRVGHAPNEVSD